MFTLIHVLISIAGIASGFIVIGGMLGGNARPPATCFFLATTIATSVTGFFFPITVITPALIFGVLSLIVLAIALFALLAKQLSGSWRKIYLITALIAQYLNTFVLVAQLFQKVPALRALAPNQSEPPFGISQALLLAIFIWLGITIVKRSRGPA